MIEGTAEPPATAVTSGADRDGDDGLWSAHRRALTLGLVLTITLVASEALAVSTIMPIVARELGGLDLYGWVFSAFFLGNLLGIVVAAALIDRGGLARPFAIGLGLFSVGLLIGGLAPSMPVLVARPADPGLRRRCDPGRRLCVDRPGASRAAPAANVRDALDRVGPPRRHRPGDRRPRRRDLRWRLVFLGLLPLIAVAATLTYPAIRAVVRATDRSGPRAHRIAEDAARRLPLATVLVVGAGMVVAGLSNLGPSPIGLVAVGVAIGAPAFSRLTPPGTLRAVPGLPAAVLLRGVMTFAFFCTDAYVAVAS